MTTTKPNKDIFADYDFSKINAYYYTNQDEPRSSLYSPIDALNIDYFIKKYNANQSSKFVFTLYNIKINGKEYSSINVTINEDHNNSFYAVSNSILAPLTETARKAVNESPALNAFIKNLDFQAIKQNRLSEILTRYKDDATKQITAAQSILDYLNS